MVEYWKRKKIGVFGSAGGIDMNECVLNARLIGQEIARSRIVLCTGACLGLPHEAAIGADNSDGVVLGFSPARNHDEHVNVFSFPTEPYALIFTGMGHKGRNLISTRTCDAGIFISGRMGTLNEFTLMYDEGEGKVIGLLAGSGGVVDNQIIPLLRQIGNKSKAAIVIESNPVELVHAVIKSMFKKT